MPASPKSKSVGAKSADGPKASKRRGAPTKRTRNSDRSKRTILEAATREFAAAGLGGARVDEIARGADVNKALIYHYFESKDTLFLAVLEAAYERIRTAELDLELESLRPTEAISALVDFTWNYYVDHPEFIALLNSENLHEGRHLEKSDRIRDINHPIVEQLEIVLERGVEEGVFREGVDALHLYFTIAALGYFYLSNAYTLSIAFDRDIHSESERSTRKDHIHDVVSRFLLKEPAS